MTIFYVTSDVVNAGVGFDLTADDADLVIDADALVGSTSTYGVFSTFSNNDVTVLGTVSGNFGIYLGDDRSVDTSNTVTVAEGGLVVGSIIGVVLASGSSAIVNDGIIRGTSFGIIPGGIVGTGSRIDNNGVISGLQYGIALDSRTTESVRMTNTGEISGDLSYVATGTNLDHLVNRGMMDGDIQLGGGNDLLDNRGGEVWGDVYLGSGNDRFDDRRGHVDGLVDAGAGNDTFFAGADAEAFVGGLGTDTLDFRGSGGLRVSLADDSGTGVAEGDSYVGFERVLGSRGGADVLIGNAGANVLSGFGGTDALDGAAGGDVLNGGGRVDTLRGGLGNDVFQCNAPDHGGDLIQDFHGVGGDNDALSISAAGFGGGLAAGVLAASQFQTRADNLAQDATDRFVFRTTDATLWFDIDGTGAAGPVLIADLQAGAVLATTDILIF